MLKPLGNSVILRKIDANKTTAGGLVIPATVQDQSNIFRGEVIAVGRGRYLDRPLQINEDLTVDFLRPEVEVGHRVIAWKARMCHRSNLRNRSKPPNSPYSRHMRDVCNSNTDADQTPYLWTMRCSYRESVFYRRRGNASG